MGWDAGFLAKLERAVFSPAVVVESITMATADAPPGGALALSSMQLTSYEQVLDARSVVLPTEWVDLRTWAWSGGQWSFVARWRTTTQRETLLDALDRGMPVQLRMGGAGDDVADYEVMALGVVEEVVERGNAITVTCWDLLTSLRTRLVRASYPIIFGYLNETASATDLTANYTAGAATLEVSSTSGFQCDADTGVYLIRVVPTTGDPFLVKATGTATGPTRFTGVTSGQFGTTAVDAVTGDDVQSVPLFGGSPGELGRKLLTSTGAGTNGTDDTLPESWGYGLPDDYIDATDMGTWNTALGPSAGAHAWTWISATRGDGTWSAPFADENGVATLQGWLGRVGMWLCMRQGQVVLRGVQDLRGGTPEDTGITITDRDLVSVEDATLDHRDAAQGFEWLKARVLTGTGGSSETGRSTNLTWPLENIYSADLESVIWDNEATQRDDYTTRIKEWYVRVPERLRVRVAGFEYMQLCPGDVVYIESSLLRGRHASTATLDGTVPYMVAGKRPGYPVPYVDLDLVTPPADGTDERE